jgi:hypothetical protein
MFRALVISSCFFVLFYYKNLLWKNIHLNV